MYLFLFPFRFHESLYIRKRKPVKLLTEFLRQGKKNQVSTQYKEKFSFLFLPIESNQKCSYYFTKTLNINKYICMSGPFHLIL